MVPGDRRGRPAAHRAVGRRRAFPAQDRNNIIYVPLYSSVFRLEDGQSAQKDEIDGIYLQMQTRDRTCPARRR